MSTRLQSRRTATSGNTPSGLLSGEIAINQPDLQLYFGDASGTTRAFLGVRVFAATASYNANEIVNNAGTLYRALASITPAAFTASQWARVSLPGAVPANVAGALTNDGSGNLSWTSYATAASVTTAQNAASAAQTTANSAQTAAGTAQTTANSAQTAAGNAQTAASGAQTTANAAQTAAGNAQTAANAAQTTATAALPKAGGALTGAVTSSSTIQALLNASTVQPTGASLARSLAARFADWANVLDFGADPTGSADSGPAFNAAFAAKGAVYAPAGTYRIATTILPNRSTMALRGAGPGVTVLMNSAANLPTIQLSTNRACGNGWVSDLTLDRSVTATAGGNGFQVDASNSFTSGQLNLFNVLSQHNYQGFNLGNTTFSIADRCVAQFNQGDGFYCTNGTWNGAVQWTLLNCLSQFNGGHGYSVVSAVPTQNLPSPTWSPTNPCYITLNTWFYCTTFANLLNGVNLVGSATAPLCDFSLHGGWIGSDGEDGLYANTFGVNNRICETVFELSSNYGTTAAGGGIGVGMNVAAPKTGNSVNITANNQDWSIVGGLINQPAYHGITTTAASTQIVGARIFNCGFARAGTYSGVSGNQGHGSIIVSGCVIGAPLAGGGMQAVGVNIYDASVVVVQGCDLRGNTLTGFGAATNIQLANVSNNLGFISRNIGVAAIANGSTSIVINHQITGTPTIVMGTPASFLPNWEINQINYTSFTITFASPVSGTCYFQWQALLSAYS